MNCPHCGKRINAFTGLQELQKFQKHLRKCRKNPDNHITDGVDTVCLNRDYSLMDALTIRAKSGQ